MAENDEKPLILFGVKHSGKSTLGKYLADMMNIPFIDVDEVIANDCGMSVRKYFEEKGEQAFKIAEYEACKKIVENNKGCFVLATGGGICDNLEALNILNGKKILVDTKEEICFERICQKAQETGSFPAFITKKNPSSIEEMKNIFHEFYTRRRELYLKICEEIVEYN